VKKIESMKKYHNKTRVYFLFLFVLLFFIQSVYIFPQGGTSVESDTGEIIVKPKNIFTTLMENVLAITIFIIFVSAIISAFIKQRAQDKCLKDFRGFHVTFILQDNIKIWGKLNLYSSGVELEYKEPFFNSKDNHLEHSYIIYQEELDANIQAIHRYHWNLTPKNKKRRKRDIKTTYKPNIFRKLARKIRNIINTLKDAFNKSLNLFLGQISSKIGGNKATTQELSTMGTTLISAVEHAYDDILEKHIGKKVIVEIKEKEEIKEYEGILKEYTAKYMELLNVLYEYSGSIKVNKIKLDSVFHDLDIELVKDKLEVTNRESNILTIDSVTKGDLSDSLDIKLECNERMIIDLAKYKSKDDIKVIFKSTRYVDIIVPRNLIKVKHAAEKGKVPIKKILSIGM